MSSDGADSARCTVPGQCRADRPLRVSSRAGAVLPAHQVSGGKLLLAELSMDEFAELYPEAGVPEASLDAAQ